MAFGKTMPLGARINALFSSNICQFEVVDMCDPMPVVQLPRRIQITLGPEAAR